MSEQVTRCGCWKCYEARGEQIMFMIVCETCGNKRCPHAADHDLDCTGSNETGQPGSAYEHGSGVATARRMMTPVSGRVGVEQTPDIEAVLRAHQWSGGYFCTCGHELNSPAGFNWHLMDALAPVLATERVKARAAELREAADALPGLTEGPLRVGTKLWPECDRDSYSLAVEEAQTALRDRADRIAVDAPTMSSAECRCPGDCDCDGRFACEATTPPPTSHVCELAVTHAGMHHSGAHSWDRDNRAVDAPEGGASRG